MFFAVIWLSVDRALVGWQKVIVRFFNIACGATVFAILLLLSLLIKDGVDGNMVDYFFFTVDLLFSFLVARAFISSENC